MKNQKFSRIMRQSAMLCACLLALAAAASVVNGQGKTKGKVVTPGDSGRASSKANAEGATTQAEVDPQIVKGLEAAAAARGKTKGKVITSGDLGVVNSMMLFEEAGKLSGDEVNRGAEVGVMYVGTGSKELPAGYYYVKLSEHVEAGKGAGAASSMYAVTLTEAQPGSASGGGGNATGRRQYRPLVIRKDVDKSSPLMKSGAGTLNLNTLGSDILAAVEQSIINTSKDNTKDY